MKQPMAIDLETSCNGKADWRYWRKGFKIDSVALTWKTPSGGYSSRFFDDPEAIPALLERLSANGTPLVCHNLQFDWGVCQTLYPQYPLNFVADTMRLAKLRDGGGDWRDFTFMSEEDRLDLLLEDSQKKMGLSLEACASRFLPVEFHNHKKMAHDWLEQYRGIKKKHGSYLHLLPRDVLEAYNCMDTEITLRLYDTLMAHFVELKFDVAQDWENYRERVQWHIGAYVRGIRVDREHLAHLIVDLEAEIAAIEERFREKAGQALLDFEATRKERFNVGSNKQLKELLIDRLGLVATKTTAKGEEAIENGMKPEDACREYPSFASKHLHTYGELGEILLQRRKTLLVLQQACGAYLQSEYDGLGHPDVRAAGTSTNRVSGGHS